MLDSSNFILSERSSEYHWRGAGLLSVKSFWGGQALYEIDSAAFLVDESSYAHDLVLSPRLSHLRESFPRRRNDQGWLDEQLQALMQQMLSVHEHTRREVASIPALRAATREELYRRLHLARDYIAASSDQPITLDTVARVAALSPDHLLRTFKQAFGQTPRQFLTEMRLKRARLLLAKSERSVTDICIQVGFESLSSFSWLFRRRFGMSPSAFRALNR